MTKERAIHELRTALIQALVVVDYDAEDGYPLATARARNVRDVLKATDEFQPTKEQLKQWSAERRQESGWVP
jgi:hypothetical protein